MYDKFPPVLPYHFVLNSTERERHFAALKKYPQLHLIILKDKPENIHTCLWNWIIFLIEPYGEISISIAHTSAFKYPRKIIWLFSFIVDFAKHYHYYKNMNCFSNMSKPRNHNQTNYKLTVDATTTHFQSQKSNIIR